MLHEFITDDEYADNVTAIVYNAGEDPWYTYSWRQSWERLFYYGTNVVPSIRIDGIHGEHLMADTALTNPYALRYDLESPIEINFQSTVSDENVDVAITVNSEEQAISGNYKLRCALISLFYDNYTGENGQTEWHWNMLQMAPDTLGTDFQIDANSSETFNLQFAWPYYLQTDLVEVDNVKVIAWVQNDDTKEVLNSEWALIGDGSVNAQEILTNETPEEFSLSQNYPNPFNPETTIGFNIPSTSQVSIIVYDVLGREIATLLNDVVKSGSHTVIWNGRNSYSNKVTSGVYFLRMAAKSKDGGSFNSTRKMLLLK
jgi:Outer membrane protein Omp28/Secretion system C-terminal sorting domain